MTAIPYPDQDAACALHEQVVERLYEAARAGVIDETTRDAWDRDFALQFDHNPAPACRVAVAERWLARLDAMEMRS